MDRRVLVVGSAVAALVALGCTKRDDRSAAAAAVLAPAANPAATCPPETKVKIDNINVPASGATATIHVDPDPARITQTPNGVRWTLKSPTGKTYQFTADGVVFKPGAVAGPASSVQGSDQYVWCFSDTSPDQSWRYSIKFVDAAAPGRVWTCDPTITNQASVDPGSAAASAPLGATVNCTTP